MPAALGKMGKVAFQLPLSSRVHHQPSLHSIPFIDCASSYTVISQETQHFQVAIVGAGIAGVTFALACERLGIEYALLEANDSLAPAEGASIGLQPNGLCILDQLDVLEEIEQHTGGPLGAFRQLDGSNGNLLSTNNAFSYFASKLGYGCLCLERQKLLEIMCGNLQGKRLIKTSCKVSSLKEDDEKMTVTTTNGFSITADIVIGADGVRSSVRRFIDSSQIGEQLESDDYMFASFTCVLGISPPMDGIMAGDCFAVYREKAAVLGFTGRDGIVFWFVFENLEKTLPLSQVPRYTAADTDTACQSVAHLQVTPTVPFSDIYANRKICVKTAIEEGIAKVWHTSRAVVIGDAAHKMTPSGAMGGNQAIESAAQLTNELGKLFKSSRDGKIPKEALKTALARYSDNRRIRTTQMQQRAAMICRAQLRHEGPAAAMFEALPSLTDEDWIFRGIQGVSDAPVLDDIPLSTRGNFHIEALASFWQRFNSGKYSKSELLQFE